MPDDGESRQDITRFAPFTIGTSSENVSKGQGSRKALYLFNASTGTQEITILLGGAGVAVAGEGIVLRAGGSFVDSDTANYEVYQGVISAVASAAGAKLVIGEW